MNGHRIDTIARASRPLRQLALFTAACALVAVASTTATARDTDEKRVTVRYTTDMLQTTRGAEALYARIGRAATDACGNPIVRDLRERQLAEECQVTAIAEAVDAIASPVLLAVHREATDEQAPRVAAASIDTPR